MESDEVAAVKVLKTGAKPMRARKTNKDDFTTFERFDGREGLELSRASQTRYPSRKHTSEIHSNARASRERSWSLTKTARNVKTAPRCWVIGQHESTRGQYVYGVKLGLRLKDDKKESGGM